MAGCFAQLATRYLLIEFVPEDDDKVQKLVENKDRENFYYDELHFETAFLLHFQFLKKQVIAGSSRTLYLMEKNMPHEE